MLEFNNISMTYDKNKDDKLVLNNISIKIENNSYVVLYGQSGSGKSTLLSIAAGLMKPTSGSVVIDGQNIYDISKKERCKFRNLNIGYLPQDSSLLNSMSVLDNVCLPSYIYNRKDDIKKIYEEGKKLLEYVGMDRYIDELPANLSGGEKRRVEIARLLINKPKYIIADEPTANLDEKNIMAILDILKKVNKDYASVLISTHDLRFLEETKNIYNIKYGKLV
ncbi:ABC transporter family protein [[Clostridium] bifermentans ATCC 19299]|uniref:ABC transporter ATP-binding protein n=1 Tax=Paraclostridium bifermentans TaxID=1490 RepID=UPI00038CA555|nr:ABC transporter ATP-binding protein [Paraclostridium bifermentans]EQK41521.1 ABC transporter family protein [[Clostridium] bifermentans ATCC 19299] [Paraclostridium bifermentans ATCC 19299]NYA10824.1 ABC transporter ATP-binding protein [Klebsiella pneumoniae]